MAITQPSCADKKGFLKAKRGERKETEGKGEGKGREGRKGKDLSSLAEY